MKRRKRRRSSPILKNIQLFFLNIKRWFSELRRKIRRMPRKKKLIMLCVIIAVCVLCIFFIARSAALKTSPAAAQAETRTVQQAKPEPTPTPEPTPEPTPDPTLSEGMENEEVNKLQERLMQLGYLDIDEPTSYYGSVTNYSVQMFQRQHGIEQTGIADPATLDMIYSEDAKYYTLLEGFEGNDVEAFQQRLMELGYMDKATGYYGTETIEAVKAFQAENELGIDGKAGEYTFDLIYSPNAVPEPSKAKEIARQGNIEEFIDAAYDQLGDPYVWGAQGPSSFDCSGLVTYCLRQAGSSTGRYNAAGFSQTSRWEKVSSIWDLERGDLIFFYNSSYSKVGHVGIVIGDGMMIDASSANGKVVKRSYESSYWIDHFVCGRRPW